MKQLLKPAGIRIIRKYIEITAYGKINSGKVTNYFYGLKLKSFLILFGLIICQAFSNTIAAQHFTLEALDAIASEKKTLQLLDAAENWYLRNSDSARSYSNAALQMAQYLENDSLIAKGHRIMGISHYYSGNFMLFAEHCEYGLETKYASNNREFAAKLWNNLGIAYEMLADYDNAIYAYNKSMELERLTQNESGYHVTQINLGLLHSKTGNSTRGLEILESALEYFIAHNDSSYIALTYQNIGKIHHDQRNHPFYDEYAVKALEIYKLLGDSVKMSDIYYNLAVNARFLGEYENWEYFLNKAGEATLSVYDLKGSLLYEVRDQFEQGSNTITIKRSDINASSGVLFYQLKSGSHAATKRLITQ